MLYESLSQPIVFLTLCLAGFLSGLIFDLKDIVVCLLKKNRIFKQIFLFFAVFLMFSVFYLTNLKINYGEMRVFALIAFFLSVSIERFFVVNFLANKFTKCYNKIKEKRSARRKKMVEKV